MTRLYVDRLAINTEASGNLLVLLLATTGRLTIANMHKLIIEAGFLPDYKDYGTDMASIRIAIRMSGIKGQAAFVKMFTPKA